MSSICFDTCTSRCSETFTSSKGGSSLCGRVCSNWRVMPAFYALAVCVTFIVCALIWRHDFLAIPPAVGVLACAYSISLACDFTDMNSIQKSSEILTAEVTRLEKVETALTTEVQSLNTKLAELEKTKDRFQDIANKMSEDRKGEIEKLRKHHEALTKGGDEAFEKLGGGLDELADLLQFFEQENQTLSTLTGQTTTAITDMQTYFREQSEVVKKYMANDKAATNALKHLRELYGEVSAKQTQLAEMTTKMQMLTPLVERLEKMERDKTRNLDRLSERTEKIGKHEQGLAAVHTDLALLKKDWERAVADLQRYQAELAKKGSHTTL